MDSKLLKETTCRMCMALSENFKEFTPISEVRTSRVEIFEEITSFNLEVNENDGLPQLICPKCIEEFDSVIQFRKRCLEVQTELRTYFEENPAVDDDENGDELDNNQEEIIDEEQEEAYQIDSENKSDSMETVLGTKYDVSEEEDENWECKYYIGSDEELDFLNACSTASKRVGKQKEKASKAEETQSTNIIDSKELGSHPSSNENREKETANDEEDNQYYAEDEMIEVSFEMDLSSEDDLNGNVDYNDIYNTLNNEHHEKLPEKCNKETKRHNCKYCDQGFEFVSLLISHLKICPKRNTVNCDICTVKFETQKLFEKHTDIFHPFGGPPMCPICSRTFENSKKRNVHMYMSHTKQEECKCNICEKVFMSKIKLSDHQRRSHVIGDHECPVCVKKFKFMSVYQAHMKTHVKNVKCRQCDKLFVSEAKAKIHERTHTTKRKHLCTFCGMTFKNGSDLNQHSDSHNNERKFKCQHCIEKFFTRRQVRNHVKINHETTRHPCDLCGKLFRQEQLPTHKYAAHNGEKPPSREPNKIYPFNCPICSKGFLTASSLLFHSKVHTEDRKHVCTECGLRYKRADHLQLHIKRIHLKIKNYACEVCGSRYLQKNQLKTHMIIHQKNRPFKCTECRMEFKTKRGLQMHSQRHTGEKIHACGICEMSFPNRRLLVLHTLTHTQEQIKEIELKVASSVGPKLEMKMETIDGEMKLETIDGEMKMENIDEQLEELIRDA